MFRRGRFTCNPGQVNKNAAPIPQIDKNLIIRKNICPGGIERNRFFCRFRRVEYFQEWGFAGGDLCAKKPGNCIIPFLFWLIRPAAQSYESPNHCYKRRKK